MGVPPGVIISDNFNCLPRLVCPSKFPEAYNSFICWATTLVDFLALLESWNEDLLNKYRKQNIEEWQQSFFLSFSVVKTDWIEVSDEGIEGNLQVHQSEAKVNHANCESACDCYVVAVIATRSIKAAKYEIQKPSTCRSTLFRCKFWSMSRVFHLASSTWPATKTSVAGWRNAARWLADLLEHEQSCCTTSCEFDEKRVTKPEFVAQSRPALYFSQQLSSSRNKCFCCATSWSRKVKNGKHRRKLATKQCCPSSWGFLYLFFCRLKIERQPSKEFCTRTMRVPRVLGRSLD